MIFISNCIFGAEIKNFNVRNRSRLEPLFFAWSRSRLWNLGRPELPKKVAAPQPQHRIQNKNKLLVVHRLDCCVGEPLRTPAERSTSWCMQRGSSSTRECRSNSWYREFVPFLFSFVEHLSSVVDPDLNWIHAIKNGGKSLTEWQKITHPYGELSSCAIIFVS